MKPCNFPARRLRRQIRAAMDDVREAYKPYEVEELDKARNERTKKCRDKRIF